MNESAEKVVDGCLSPISEPSAMDSTQRDVVELGGYKWMLVAGGICLAGAAYPTIVYGTMVLMMCLSHAVALALGVQSNLAALDLVYLVWTLALQLFIGGIVGLVWAGLVSLFVLPIFMLFVRSLNLRANIIWLGAIAGGLVGLMSFTPLAALLLAFRGNSPAFTHIMVVIVVGPCAATAVGQIGGAWGGRRAYRERIKRLTSGQVTALAAHQSADRRRQPLLQFHLRHLLWITFWLALLLTTIRFIGVPFELVLPFLAAWMAFQATTLYLGWKLLTQWWPRWRARRARRST